MLKLFLSPGSCSMAPHIALREIGADFEIRSLSFVRREDREPAYLAINSALDRSRERPKLHTRSGNYSD